MSAASPSPAAIRASILELLAARAAGRTICPSETARVLGGNDAFRPLMDPVREEAFSMVDEGLLEVTQKGVVVDGRVARGPIRLRLPDNGSNASNGSA